MSTKQIILSMIVGLIVMLSVYFCWPRHDPSITEASSNADSAVDNNVEPQPSRPAIADRSNSVPIQNLQKHLAINEQVNANLDQEKALWDSPIQYYGRVTDEKGMAIQGVKVSFKVHAMNEKQTEDVNDAGETATDQRGMFRIDAPHGIGVMVELSHSNYYPYPDNVTGFDKRSLPKSGHFSDTEENAQLFQMHSKGKPVSLIHREGGLHIPPNGTITDFPFRGATRNEIIGESQIQGWKDNSDPQNKGHYDWKVKIQVPDGGIFESTNYFDFIAPETGYANSLEFGMLKDDPNWQSHLEKRVFLKLSGHYVRATLTIDVFHDLFFSMDYFVNPDGSSNLENDPNQRFQGQ